MFSRKTVIWLCLLAAALSALVVSTQLEGPPRTNEDRVRSLSEDFACPTCDGQSVAESNAVVAQEIRREIRRQVDDGRTDEQITDALVASYNESIDLRPRSGGVVGLVWDTSGHRDGLRFRGVVVGVSSMASRRPSIGH